MSSSNPAPITEHNQPTSSTATPHASQPPLQTPENSSYSVLMSVYHKDSPSHLATAIDSMLNQTVPPAEFLIIADGPLTPQLDQTLAQYQTAHPQLFRLIRLSTNQGLGLALRRGITECRYDLIARMDADDYCPPSRIAKQLAVFAADPTLDLVGSNANEFTGDITNVVSKVILPEYNADIIKFSKRRCPFRHPALLYRKSSVLAAGNYRDYYLCEDYDLYTRMLQNGANCYNIQEPLLYVRVDADFYQRRGHFKYFNAIRKFKREQYTTGYFTYRDYLLSVIPSMVVTLMPNFIRTFFYKKFLRS